jgi:hypothetical protein
MLSRPPRLEMGMCGASRRSSSSAAYSQTLSGPTEGLSTNNVTPLGDPQLVTVAYWRDRAGDCRCAARCQGLRSVWSRPLAAGQRVAIISRAAHHHSTSDLHRFPMDGGSSERTVGFVTPSVTAGRELCGSQAQPLKLKLSSVAVLVTPSCAGSKTIALSLPDQSAEW